MLIQELFVYAFMNIFVMDIALKTKILGSQRPVKGKIHCPECTPWPYLIFIVGTLFQNSKCRHQIECTSSVWLRTNGQRIVNFMAGARVNLGFDCCKAKTHKVVVPPRNATPFDPLCFRQSSLPPQRTKFKTSSTPWDFSATFSFTSQLTVSPWFF